MKRLWNAAPEVLVALSLIGAICTVAVSCSQRYERMQPAPVGPFGAPKR